MPVGGQFTREFNQEMARKGVVSDDPINMQFPDQFSIGSSDNEPGKLQIHFD